MAVVVAILLALFVLPSPWGLVAILAAVALEVGESWFWIRFTQCRPDGRVRVRGELWRARCAGGAEVGEHVRVVRIDDLTLQVE